MANLGSVVVQFLAKDKMGDTLGKITGKLKKVDDQTGKTTGGFGKLSAAWAASIPIAGAVVAGAIGMANALVDASKAALEDKNSADKLAGTLKNIPGITDAMVTSNEDWISSMQLATLVSDTELRTAVGKLTLATGDLTKAQDLTKLAVDASTASGKSLSTVTDALAKAANGNTASLQRQFPWLDKNKDGTLTYKEAVEGLGNAYTGAAEKATKTKPWETIQTIWGEIQESLGGVLLPLFEKFGDWFSKKENRDSIQKFIDRVSELATKLGDDLVDAIKDAVDWLKKPENQAKIREWISMMGSFASSIGSVVSAIQTLITWLNKIPSAPTGGLGLLRAGLRGGGGGGGSSGGASRSAGTLAPVTNITVNVEGAVDPYNTARIIERQLGQYARIQGRATPAAAVAW